MTDEPKPGALDSLRVIDLTRVLAGPFCTMLLGDMGADIIKVEQPGHGDDTRAWGPPFVGEESAYFLSANRNKRGMTLNLKHEAGQEILGELVRGADVVIDNFKLGTMARFGFDDAWYEANAPQIVRCSILGYGSTGPRAGLPGYDFLLQAESGLMAITGEAEGEPMKLGVAIVDLCTGLYALSTILAAINARHRSGHGQAIEVSLYDTGVSLLANVAANFLASGKAAGRYGNGHPNIVPYNAYPTGDGMIALSIGNDTQFATFCNAVGHTEWAEDERFARNRDRVANRGACDGMIADLFRTDTTAAWLDKLLAASVSCAPINTVEQALTAAHTVARGLVTTANHTTEGEIKIPGIPFRFSRDPAAIRRAPPVLGEHTDAVLSELGKSAEDIVALREAGAI
ncbi:MAG: CaiB/BaiF CoA-transferase family protein [Alphaproteobacteria bacterium]|nr:CaiB/BaiF CoA-transferase family protein [Alphaproteobacteria bacterium]